MIKSGHIQYLFGLTAETGSFVSCDVKAILDYTAVWQKFENIASPKGSGDETRDLSDSSGIFCVFKANEN
jgi:hypothetical protein